jgi:LisH
MATGALSLPPTQGTSTQNQQPSWEGDKMFVQENIIPLLKHLLAFVRFNIYIYDYCNKRGFRETAQKLMVEAEIPPDSAPPINAKQGLLFEYVRYSWNAPT